MAPTNHHKTPLSCPPSPPSSPTSVGHKHQQCHLNQTNFPTSVSHWRSCQARGNMCLHRAHELRYWRNCIRVFWAIIRSCFCREVRQRCRSMCCYPSSRLRLRGRPRRRQQQQQQRGAGVVGLVRAEERGMGTQLAKMIKELFLDGRVRIFSKRGNVVFDAKTVRWMIAVFFARDVFMRRIIQITM